MCRIIFFSFVFVFVQCGWQGAVNKGMSPTEQQQVLQHWQRKAWPSNEESLFLPTAVEQMIGAYIPHDYQDFCHVRVDKNLSQRCLLPDEGRVVGVQLLQNGDILTVKGNTMLIHEHLPKGSLLASYALPNKIFAFCCNKRGDALYLLAGEALYCANRSPKSAFWGAPEQVGNNAPGWYGQGCLKLNREEKKLFFYDEKSQYDVGMWSVDELGKGTGAAPAVLYNEVHATFDATRDMLFTCAKRPSYAAPLKIVARHMGAKEASLLWELETTAVRTVRRLAFDSYHQQLFILGVSTERYDRGCAGNVEVWGVGEQVPVKKDNKKVKSPKFVFETPGIVNELVFAQQANVAFLTSDGIVPQIVSPDGEMCFLSLGEKEGLLTGALALSPKEDFLVGTTGAYGKVLQVLRTGEYKQEAKNKGTR